jgi:hypothetical protein
VQGFEGQEAADLILTDILLRLEGASDHLRAHLTQLSQSDPIQRLVQSQPCLWCEKTRGYSPPTCEHRVVQTTDGDL